MRMRKRVVLPEPLRPIMATLAPGTISKFRFSKTRWVPKTLLTPSIRTAQTSAGTLISTVCTRHRLKFSHEQRRGPAQREKQNAHNGKGLKIAVVNPCFNQRLTQKLLNA